MNANPTPADSTPAKPGWGGARANAGRRQGGHNPMSADKIRQQASRHIERMKLDAGGVVVPVWQGKRASNRYRMTNAYILKLLEITDEEQVHMNTIISTAEKNRRRVEARRAAGMRTREELQSDANEKKAKALELAAQGLSQSAIAAEIGVGQQRVSRLLKAPAGHEYKDHAGVTANANILAERERIFALRADGCSVRTIASTVGRSVSFVHGVLKSA